MRSRGSLTTNRAPPPGAGSQATSPPRASTTPRTTTRPVLLACVVKERLEDPLAVGAAQERRRLAGELAQHERGRLGGAGPGEEGGDPR
jgi:hypothetical protein